MNPWIRRIVTIAIMFRIVRTALIVVIVIIALVAVTLSVALDLYESDFVFSMSSLASRNIENDCPV